MRTKKINRLILLVLVLFSYLISANAVPSDIYPFQSNVQHIRFQNLTQNLRCLVCQNESLAESNAPLAKDLRQQIYHMIKKDKNDKDIIHFLVSRYGNFILFNPPVNRLTYFIWFGPFLLLGLALMMLFFAIRRKKSEKADD